MGLLKIIFAPIRFLYRLLVPKPKKTKPPETTDMENPTAEAGRPWPVVFGTVTVKGINCLWYGDKSTRKSQVNAP